MIVLEELPLLVSSSLAGCLIPDRVFLEGASCPSEKELRLERFRYLHFFCPDIKSSSPESIDELHFSTRLSSV